LLQANVPHETEESLKIPASEYFVNKYLIFDDQKNGFLRKYWKFMVECRGEDLRSFFLSLYPSTGIFSRFQFVFIKMTTMSGFYIVFPHLFGFLVG
jgi:hypothetical protein